MPFPIELLLMILATVGSYYMDLNKKYNVTVMGSIPTGLPGPVIPKVELFPHLIVESITLAFIIFAISLSIAKIIAKKHRYSVDPNQELVAIGSANIFSSFFSCYPCSASLSRTLVQDAAGGKTQVTGMVSALVILVVLLFIGPFFYHLPKCILACIILVALKGMFKQYKDFLNAMKVSAIDAIIWFVTFLAVVLLDIDWGLLTGIIISIVCIIYRSVRPYSALLGNAPGTEFYLDAKYYSEVREVSGVKIFHFGSPIYFANVDSFKSNFYKKCLIEGDNPVHHLIMDFSSISYVDYGGIESLIEICEILREHKITLYFAACSVPVYNLLVNTRWADPTTQPMIFPTVHDAVQYCFPPKDGSNITIL